jgi:D-tyrosyl-tRNA(Tyr) deacylase
VHIIDASGVASAKVVVDGVTVGEIGKGLLVLGGICDSDDSDDGKAAIEWAVRKVLGTRLWEDAAGKSWARSVQQEGLEVLLVSQFTLHGKPCHQTPQPATSRGPAGAKSQCMHWRGSAVLKGNKPDFHHAMPPARSRPFWDKFVAAVEKKLPGKVQQGQFGALMQVHLVNDGPVTITLDSEANASAPAPAPAPQPPAPPPTPPPPPSPAAPARIGIAVAAAVVVLGLLHHARKAFRS